jgi:hypothetical protein
VVSLPAEPKEILPCTQFKRDAEHYADFEREHDNYLTFERILHSLAFVALNTVDPTVSHQQI